MLRPLLATPTPTPIDYPILSGPGNVVGERKTWSIGPICDCFSMQELSLNCCCANCLCFPWYTYTRALKYMGLRDVERDAVAAALASIDFGDSQAAEGAEAALKLRQTIIQQERRRELVNALGLYREGSEGFFLRCCCTPCMQCQEVDTVFTFYRDSLGFRDIQYGNCFACQCARFYSQGRLIPFPDEIRRDESPGPNYTKTDWPKGYKFDQGVPVARTGEEESERRPRNSLLPRFF